MQSLDKRISALENASPSNIGPMFIHLVGFDVKDREIERITKGNQEWLRKPAETEQELKDRATREVPPPDPGCTTTFLCY